MSARPIIKGDSKNNASALETISKPLFTRPPNGVVEDEIFGDELGNATSPTEGNTESFIKAPTKTESGNTLSMTHN